MLYNKFAFLAAFSAGVLADPRNGNNNGGKANAAATAATAATSATGTTGGNGGTGLTLDAAAVQSGSFVDGSTSIGAEAGQAKSQTSQNNFINFCSGKTLTNGLQIVTGSCNGIVMGDIPAKTNMVSSIVVFPQTGSQIASDTDFTIQVQMNNLVAGSFTDADATYYGGPQFLQNGIIVGHTHVTVQDLGKTLNPVVAPDATQFAFFKGINDAGNGKGLLSANVTGGLPAGNYRVCTMAASSNHAPVLMPVAQRGSPDDCTKFVVTGNGNVANAASNNGAKGQAAAALASNAVVGATNSAFAASILASESAAAAAAAAGAATATAAAAQVSNGANGGNGAKAAKGGKKGNKNAAASTAVSAAVSAAASTAVSTAASTDASTAASSVVVATPSVAVTATTAASAASATLSASSAANASTTATKGRGRGGRGGRGGKLRFAKREFVA